MSQELFTSLNPDQLLKLTDKARSPEDQALFRIFAAVTIPSARYLVRTDKILGNAALQMIGSPNAQREASVVAQLVLPQKSKSYLDIYRNLSIDGKTAPELSKDQNLGSAIFGDRSPFASIEDYNGEMSLRFREAINLTEEPMNGHDFFRPGLLAWLTMRFFPAYYHHRLIGQPTNISPTNIVSVV